MPGRKAFLAGLGTGLLICGLLLRFLGRGGEDIGDWKAEAERHGYLLIRKEEADKGAFLFSERTSSAPSAGPASATPHLSATPAPTAMLAPTATPAVSGAFPQPSFFPAGGNRVQVWIPPGAISEDVVRVLAEAGVVGDEDALRSEMETRAKTRKIVAGTYVFDRATAVRDVVDRITMP